LRAAQTAFGCTLIGGDTDKAPGPLTIAISVIGEVPSGRMVRRGGAKAGDLIFVSGTIGDSALGLQSLKDSDLRAAWNISESDTTFLINRYYRPQPRLALRMGLLKYASAAMDISDGLAKDLERMASASGVSATLHAHDVPLSPAAAKVVAALPDWRTGVLVGGDDYEILCAVPPDHADAFKRDAAAAGVPVTCVGAFGGGAGLIVLDASGAPIELKRKGWDHFA
jgi:thiamine-monophosphate kinase